jgi:hypothetical protein
MKLNQWRRFLAILISASALILLCRFGGFSVTAQRGRCVKPELQRQIHEQGSRKRLGIPYSKAVQFKLGSRKTVYKDGEIITLDLAILNTSGASLFIYKPARPFLSFKVVSDEGKQLDVRPYSSVLAGVAPSSFGYIDRSGLLTASFQIFVSCNSRQLAEFQKAQQDLLSRSNLDEALYNRSLFENNLFATWGDACLLSSSPSGTFTIVAELSNDYVVWSPCEPLAKTAVGTVESKALTVRVQE